MPAASSERRYSRQPPQTIWQRARFVYRARDPPNSPALAACVARDAHPKARPFAGTYDHLYLDIYPPSLQAAQTSHIDAIQPLRPVAFADPGESAEDWSSADANRPLVYVTFGTVFNRDIAPIAMAVAALRELAVRVVVTLGPGRDLAALGDQPANVHVAGYIAQTELLPHCAAVVSHAGSGTFLAAIARGLPQLFLPQAADQFLNASAGARCGAGIAIQPHELTVDNARTAARQLLDDPAFRGAAERVSGLDKWDWCRRIAPRPRSSPTTDRLYPFARQPRVKPSVTRPTARRSLGTTREPLRQGGSRVRSRDGESERISRSMRA